MRDSRKPTNEDWRLSPRPCLLVEASSGEILAANRAAEDFWGYDAADLRGRPLSDLVDADSVEAFLAAAREGRNFAANSVTIRQISGASHVVTCAARAVQGAWALAFREPGRIGPAHELRRLNYALNAYARSSAALMQTGETRSVMEQVCRAIVGQEVYVLACVALPAADGSPWLDYAAAAGPATGYLDGLRISASAELAEGQGATGMTLRSGAPHLIRDTRKDASYALWRERGARYGVRSMVSVPITVAGATVGALLVYAARPNAFGPTELNLFWRLCQAIGLALTMEQDRRRLGQAEEARRLAEARASAANAQWQRVSRLSFIGEFAAALAHEISQPLGAIEINAQAGLRWLHRPAPDLGEAGAALERIGRDAKRAHEIVARTRAMYRGETAAAPFDLREAVEDVLVITRERCANDRIALEVALEDVGLVLGDRIQAQQVVFNLIANAADALGDVSGRPRHLKVTIRRQGDKALAGVEDDGPGVAAEAAERLFDRFFTTKPQGLGLGLPLSRRIIEAQGGRLWFEPVKPQGARFLFTLPLA